MPIRAILALTLGFLLAGCATPPEGDVTTGGGSPGTAGAGGAASPTGVAPVISEPETGR